MNKNTTIRLATLGSPSLQHFFVLTKRLMGANQSVADFQRAILKSVTAKTAMTAILAHFKRKGKAAIQAPSSAAWIRSTIPFLSQSISKKPRSFCSPLLLGNHRVSIGRQ
jgi:hypothetical protein